MPSDAQPAPPSQIEPLTALRFAAAAWVVLYHYWPKLNATGLGSEAEAVRPALIAQGYLGVELFFVLSGFILCHVYLAAVETGRFRYGAFMRARFARVYPLHIFTLAGVGALAAGAVFASLSVGDGLISWAALPANLFMVHAWGLVPEAAWNHPSWSISAEWFAYLAFPAFAAAALPFRSRPWLGVTLAALLLVGLYAGFEAVTGEHLTQATIAWGALRIVPCFALGCALFLLWRSGALAGRGVAVTGFVGSATLLTAAAALSAPDALTVLAGGGVIVSLAALWSSREPDAVPGALMRVGVYLGEISYAIYMLVAPWALLFVNGAGKALDLPGETLPLPLWLVMIAGLIPVSAAVHHLVERPARQWLRGETRREPGIGGLNLGTNRGRSALKPAPAR
jgi:peptidoglycan/LPS O-acetylase OafA/YrhL